MSAAAILRKSFDSMLTGLRAAVDAPRDGSTQPAGQSMLVTGWCFFPDGPARLVELRLDGRPLLVSRPNQPRPDVLEAHPEATAFGGPVGFHFVVEPPRGLALGRHVLEIYALDGQDRRALAGRIGLEFLSRASGSTFSQRFADIPAPLVAKVNGSEREEDFLRIGTAIADIIEKNLDELPFSNAERVLDFGCGLGRVLAPLMVKLPGAQFFGFDIDPSMIEWLTYLHRDPRCRFVNSTLELPDETFDIIIAISVFTHLDTTTDYWLSEVQRMLSPQGLAFLTYHNETAFEHAAGTPLLPHVEKGAKLDGYYVTGKSATEGGAVMGTFYTTSRWEQTVGRWFDVQKTVPRGLLNHQSFSVVKKRHGAVDVRTADRAYIRELERQLYELRRAHRELI